MTESENIEPSVLTIAGSDPSGGAGIQADIKTFTSIGVYGGAVISCLTVQNTREVSVVQPVDGSLVKKQIKSVLGDLNISHIKIGMLGSAAVAESISEALNNYTGEIIYDPVLVSSSGRELIEPDGYETIKKHLLPICTVLTPNIPELAALTNEDCLTKDALLGAAAELFRFCTRLRTLIITGGHFESRKDTVTDFMLKNPARHHGNGFEEISHPRIKSRNTHGTGCTFSAAFTAYHLLTMNDSEAFRKSVDYVDKLISGSVSVKIGHGTGPLLHHLK